MRLWRNIAALLCAGCVSGLVAAQDYKYFSIDFDKADEWAESEAVDQDANGNFTVAFEHEDKISGVAIAIVSRPLDGINAAQTTADFLAAQGFYVSEVTTDNSGVYYFTSTDSSGSVDHVLVKGNGERYALISVRGNVDEADFFLSCFSKINDILPIPAE